MVWVTPWCLCPKNVCHLSSTICSEVFLAWICFIRITVSPYISHPARMISITALVFVSRLAGTSEMHTQNQDFCFGEKLLFLRSRVKFSVDLVVWVHHFLLSRWWCSEMMILPFCVWFWIIHCLFTMLMWCCSIVACVSHLIRYTRPCSAYRQFMNLW